jgi:hypothetical protein
LSFLQDLANIFPWRRAGYDALSSRVEAGAAHYTELLLKA